MLDIFNNDAYNVQSYFSDLGKASEVLNFYEYPIEDSKKKKILINDKEYVVEASNVYFFGQTEPSYSLLYLKKKSDRHKSHFDDFYEHLWIKNSDLNIFFNKQKH